MLLLFTPALIAIVISAPVIIADALNYRSKPVMGHADGLATCPLSRGQFYPKNHDYEYMQQAENN